MERICTLCNYSTQSDFQWESHLARDDHRLAKLKFDNDAMLYALQSALAAYSNMTTDQFSKGADKAIREMMENVINKVELE
jgi:hypothetical protein